MVLQPTGKWKPVLGHGLTLGRPMVVVWREVIAGWHCWLVVTVRSMVPAALTLQVHKSSACGGTTHGSIHVRFQFTGKPNSLKCEDVITLSPRKPFREFLVELVGTNRENVV